MEKEAIPQPGSSHAGSLANRATWTPEDSCYQPRLQAVRLPHWRGSLQVASDPHAVGAAAWRGRDSHQRTCSSACMDSRRISEEWDVYRGLGPPATLQPAGCKAAPANTGKCKRTCNAPSEDVSNTRWHWVASMMSRAMDNPRPWFPFLASSKRPPQESVSSVLMFQAKPFIFQRQLWHLVAGMTGHAYLSTRKARGVLHQVIRGDGYCRSPGISMS